MLVEDNPDDRELAMLALEQSTLLAEIMAFADGRQALDFLFARGIYQGRQLTALPDLILLDLKLPGVDGLELLRQLRAGDHTKLIPVVILTTSNEPQDLINSYSLGCNSYISKPVDFLEFREMFRQLVHYWLVLNQASPRLPGTPKPNE